MAKNSADGFMSSFLLWFGTRNNLKLILFGAGANFRVDLIPKIHPLKVDIIHKKKE